MIITWRDLRELITDTNNIRSYAVDENNIFTFLFSFFFDTVACLAVYLRKIVERSQGGSVSLSVPALHPNGVVGIEHTDMCNAALSEKLLVLSLRAETSCYVKWTRGMHSSM